MLNTIQGQIVARISDIETLCVLFFILWLIYPQQDKKMCLLKGGCCTITGMSLILIVEKISQSYSAYLICFIIIGIVYAKWTLNLDIKKSLLVSIFYIAAQFSLSFVEEWIGMYFLGNLFGAYRSIFTQLFILLFFWVFRKLFRKIFCQEQYIPLSYYILVIIIFICSLIVKNNFISHGIHYYRLNDMKYPGVISILLFIINLLIFYLYSRITADRIHWKQTYTLQMKYEFEQKTLEDIILNNQILAQRQHDFKQHIFTLKYLADRAEYEELKQYCNNLLNQSSQETLQTGNLIVNAIVSQKKAQAHEQGIDLIVESDQLPISLPIKNIDLSVLIGNMLDNAIEACYESKDKDINLKIKMFPGYIVIRVTNPVKENVLKKNPNLCSTKKNKLIHGFGIPSIRLIAEKYSGKLSVEIKNKKFQATAILFWQE
ncbi:MAG: GHKL domain-containing protein [Eubacteriales bacterium]|nr:GHKL domain-containing protein [Eubacteriales bacterium]